MPLAGVLGHERYSWTVHLASSGGQDRRKAVIWLLLERRADIKAKGFPLESFDTRLDWEYEAPTATSRRATSGEVTR